MSWAASLSWYSASSSTPAAAAPRPPSSSPAGLEARVEILGEDHLRTRLHPERLDEPRDALGPQEAMTCLLSRDGSRAGGRLGTPGPSSGARREGAPSATGDGAARPSLIPSSALSLSVGEDHQPLQSSRTAHVAASADRCVQGVDVGDNHGGRLKALEAVDRRVLDLPDAGRRRRGRWGYRRPANRPASSSSPLSRLLNERRS